MGAEDVPQLFVAALADEVQVDLTQCRQEAVGVVKEVFDPVAVRDPDPLVRDLCGWKNTYPYAFELMPELGARAIGHLHKDSVRQRFERADGNGAVMGMGPKNSMRVVMGPGDQPLELAAFDGLHR